MRHYDFEESIGYWLCITAGAMQQAINDELSKHGITYRQFQVLGWLVHDGEQLTQAELAAKMMIEPPTLVGLLDRMEQQGWITRAGCPSDRRKKLVCIAPAAEAVWETMVEALLHVRGKATSRLAPEQVESLKEILRVVHGTLAEAAPEPATAER